MIEIKHHEDCCGCAACYHGCKHNAITLHTDVLGFL